MLIHTILHMHHAPCNHAYYWCVWLYIIKEFWTTQESTQVCRLASISSEAMYTASDRLHIYDRLHCTLPPIVYISMVFLSEGDYCVADQQTRINFWLTLQVSSASHRQKRQKIRHLMCLIFPWWTYTPERIPNFQLINLRKQERITLRMTIVFRVLWRIRYRKSNHAVSIRAHAVFRFSEWPVVFRILQRHNWPASGFSTFFPDCRNRVYTYNFRLPKIGQPKRHLMIRNIACTSRWRFFTPITPRNMAPSSWKVYKQGVATLALPTEH